MSSRYTYHSRERLVELFRNGYDDPRDVKKVLDMILAKHGIVNLALWTRFVYFETATTKGIIHGEGERRFFGKALRAYCQGDAELGWVF